MRRPIRNIGDTATDLGINREITGKKRNRLFVYDEYLKRLSEGTDPLA
ncbi:MAG: hypothetical protein ABR558_07675 [Thioalkalivibrio sp.]